MGFISWIRGIWKKMIGISDVESIVGQEVSLSTDMQYAMNRWLNEYVDNPAWASDTVPVLGIPSGIASEVTRLAMLEFEFLGAGNNERGKFITNCMKKALDDVSDDLELALAVGGMFPKPYITEDNMVGVEWVPQYKVFPLSDEAGNVTGAVFAVQKTGGNIIYTRLEIHELTRGVYSIRNYAYTSKTSDNPFANSVELSKVPGWENIAPEQTWAAVEHPAFSVFRVPGKNKIDLDSPLGESIFSRAEGLIQDADIQYGRFLWEFEATEAAIHADAQAFKSTVNADGTITSAMPAGRERLYRLVQNVGKMGDGGFFENYSPTIRDTAQINGLNQILMLIENRCGLVRGTLSNDKLSDSYTNELELKLARNRGENTVNRVQKAFAETITDLCMAINTLCDLYGLAGNTGIVPEDVQIKFGDSIVQDDTSRLEQMRQDVNDGIIPKWMYVKEKYGFTEEEAKAIAAQGVSTSTPVEDSLFGADMGGAS